MCSQNLSNCGRPKRDQSISHCFFTARPLSELPAFYWDNKRSIESVFDAVNATKLNEDNLKGAKIFHEVQKLLIINDIPNVLNVVDEWSKSASTNEQEILRFFAHMVIMLKRLDKTSVGSQGKYPTILSILPRTTDTQ